MALNPALKALMKESAAKYQEPVEDRNEYLSDEKWDLLHLKVAECLIPIAACDNVGATAIASAAAKEMASLILSDISIMPESCREDAA